MFSHCHQQWNSWTWHKSLQVPQLSVQCNRLVIRFKCPRSHAYYSLVFLLEISTGYRLLQQYHHITHEVHLFSLCHCFQKTQYIFNYCTLVLWSPEEFSRTNKPNPEIMCSNPLSFTPPNKLLPRFCLIKLWLKGSKKPQT